MFGDLQTALLFLLALVISISVHEAAHAWSAYELGDATARSMGRLQEAHGFDVILLQEVPIAASPFWESTPISKSLRNHAIEFVAMHEVRRPDVYYTSCSKA